MESNSGEVIVQFIIGVAVMYIIINIIWVVFLLILIENDPYDPQIIVFEDGNKSFETDRRLTTKEVIEVCEDIKPYYKSCTKEQPWFRCLDDIEDYMMDTHKLDRLTTHYIDRKCKRLDVF